MINDSRPLKLLAKTNADLEVVSALLQDGLVASADMQYDSDTSSFMMLINRYCRGEIDTDEQPFELRRRLCGVNIAQVKNVRRRGFGKTTHQFYNLLAIRYEQSEAILNLIFSGGAAIQIVVSELMIMLADVAEAHPSFAHPKHDIDQDND